MVHRTELQALAEQVLEVAYVRDSLVQKPSFVQLLVTHWDKLTESFKPTMTKEFIISATTSQSVHETPVNYREANLLSSQTTLEQHTHKWKTTRIAKF